MPRSRIFRRVLLSDLLEAEGWTPTERPDGTRGFTVFSEGRAATLVEYREDYDADLMRAMERRAR